MEGKVFFPLLIIVCLSFSSGETTFFEEGFGGSFIISGDTNEDASSVYCGNAICDSGEDCENCKKDCGSCSSGGSFGTGRVVDNVSDPGEVVSGVNNVVEVFYSRDRGDMLIIVSVGIGIAVVGLFYLWRRKR